jgi:tol-pal system protein YbgF
MRLRFFLTLFIAVLGGASFFAVSPARAQSDTSGLLDRLDRLERDLNTLQAQVYRGQTPPPAKAAPVNTGAAAPNSNVYSLLDSRITAIESEMQELTAKVELSSHNVDVLQSKVDRMQSDNEFRFKALESRGAPPPMADVGAPPAAEAPASDLGAPPGYLVHPGAKPGAPPPIAPPAAAQTPQQQYDYALGLLKKQDYDGANSAFQSFIAQHANDPLAGNATYWLGQIPFAQGEYDKAAVLFLDVYQKYPKSVKAPESLLKVGLSMSNLGKKKEACAAIHRFISEYPDSGLDLRRQADAEKKKLGC